MSAIGWKTYDKLKKSTLFDSIKGHGGWQACSQIVTDRRKWSIGLDLPESDMVFTLRDRVKNPLPTVDVDSASAPVKQVIELGDQANLHTLPAMVTSEKDPGPFIASGMVVVKDPDTGIRNLSVHRQQIMGPRKTGFVMVPRHARRIYEKYCARGEAMPVAIVIGAHPSIFFGAAFTSTFGLDELTVAGAVLNDPIRMVKCETVDLEVPAEAEIVLEGEILPNHEEPEGPFGEITGTYAEIGKSQIFNLKAITRRADPIFYAIHCGAPLNDTLGVTGLCMESVIADHLRHVEGGVDLLDLRCVGEAGNMMFIVKLRPKITGQAKTILMAALSSSYLHPKLAIAVDEDIDTSDLRQIMWSLTTRVHAQRDVVMIPDTRVFALDNVSPIDPGQDSFHRVGTKWLIDATMPALSQAEERQKFELALPLHLHDINLDDFLP